MKNRGFSCIALHNPKTPANVGSVLRAANCYGASQVTISGPRTCWKWIDHGTNTSRAHRHMPLFRTSEPLDCRPWGTEVVVIELIEGAKDLRTFTHPERALYVFGPEDGTLGKSITDKAQHVVQIPTRVCMNLAATVNVVLYDRLLKRGEELTPETRNAGKVILRNAKSAITA